MEVKLIYSTIDTVERAKTIGHAIVKSRLAACVNLIPSVESIYRWEGKIETGNEILLIAKTKASLVNRVIEKITSMHRYSCPCVVALPIETGNQAFLNWIVDEVKISE